jgi:multiple sugar transport system ATP-binding protein
LGSEALIHASLMGAPFVIRTDTLGQLDILDDISGFTIEPHLIRVFDAKTGQALPGQVMKQ